MGKRVRVLTKCGEESFYDFDQEVDTVEIIESPPTPNKTETVGKWEIHYFDDTFLVVNTFDKSDRFEFVLDANGWINTCKSPTIYKGAIMNDI